MTGELPHHRAATLSQAVWRGPERHTQARGALTRCDRVLNWTATEADVVSEPHRVLAEYVDHYNNEPTSAPPSQIARSAVWAPWERLAVARGWAIASRILTRAKRCCCMNICTQQVAVD
jgi:hypothetical protein